MPGYNNIRSEYIRKFRNRAATHCIRSQHNPGTPWESIPATYRTPCNLILQSGTDQYMLCSYIVNPAYSMGAFNDRRREKLPHSRMAEAPADITSVMWPWCSPDIDLMLFSTDDSAVASQKYKLALSSIAAMILPPTLSNVAATTAVSVGICRRISPE
jgi:hypothetical protein